MPPHPNYVALFLILAGTVVLLWAFAMAWAKRKRIERWDADIRNNSYPTVEGVNDGNEP